MTEYKIRYTHYSTMGATMAPPCADPQGWLQYRDGFEDFPPSWWSESEQWIHEQEQRIAEWQERGN